MKSPSQLIFSIFITIVLFSGVIIVFEHKGFASQVLNFSFFILFLGIILYILEVKQKK